MKMFLTPFLMVYIFRSLFVLREYVLMLVALLRHKAGQDERGEILLENSSRR